MAQLQLTAGSIYKACDALKQLGDLKYKPGLVSSFLSKLSFQFLTLLIFKIKSHQQSANSMFQEPSDQVLYYSQKALKLMILGYKSLQLFHF